MYPELSRPPEGDISDAKVVRPAMTILYTKTYTLSNFIYDNFLI